MFVIEQDMIPESRANRRTTQRGSAYYQKWRKMDYITVHSVGSFFEDNPRKDVYWYGWYITTDPSTENPPGNRKAWHYTIGPAVKRSLAVMILQHLLNNEVGLHSGQGLFAGVLNGNSNSIAIEMLKSYDPDIQQDIENATAWLCAKLIREGQVSKPYPECLKQHWDWPRANGSRKNCPSILRNRPGGWEEFVAKVGEYLGVAEDTAPRKYRVIVGSYTDPINAEKKAVEVERMSPYLRPEIVYNQVGDRKLYRVVVLEDEQEMNATTLKDWLQGRGEDAFIITVQGDIDLEMPQGYKPPIEKPEKPEWKEEPPKDDSVGEGTGDDPDENEDDLEGLSGLINLLIKKLSLLLKLLKGGGIT